MLIEHYILSLSLFEDLDSCSDIVTPLWYLFIQVNWTFRFFFHSSREKWRLWCCFIDRNNMSKFLFIFSSIAFISLRYLLPLYAPPLLFSPILVDYEEIEIIDTFLWYMIYLSKICSGDIFADIERGGEKLQIHNTIATCFSRLRRYMPWVYFSPLYRRRSISFFIENNRLFWWCYRRLTFHECALPIFQLFLSISHYIYLIYINSIISPHYYLMTFSRRTRAYHAYFIRWFPHDIRVAWCFNFTDEFPSKMMIW